MTIEIQSIPLADLARLPDTAGDMRFKSVLRAHSDGVPVPPILLTITTRRGGCPYDLLDGCHRLAAARALGHETIPAVVITQFGAARIQALAAYGALVRQHHERHGDGPADSRWLAQLAREPGGSKVFGLSSGAPPPAGSAGVLPVEPRTVPRRPHKRSRLVLALDRAKAMRAKAASR